MNFGEKIRFHTANFWENEISKRRVLSVGGILKCLIFEFSPFEKHVAIWHLIGNRNTQKFICTSHAINQSLRSWNLLCLCHYSLTLSNLDFTGEFCQIMIAQIVWYARKELNKKKVEIFHQRNFYDEWNCKCGFSPDFIKTSLKFSIFGVINTNDKKNQLLLQNFHRKSLFGKKFHCYNR